MRIANILVILLHFRNGAFVAFIPRRAAASAAGAAVMVAGVTRGRFFGGGGIRNKIGLRSFVRLRRRRKSPSRRSPSSHSLTRSLARSQIHLQRRASEGKRAAMIHMMGSPHAMMMMLDAAPIG